MIAGAPTISVVVPTRDGWTAYRPAFEAHRRAIERVGGELIVVDGSLEATPAASLVGSMTHWLKYPGESVLALRAHGYPAARGAIVAQSEDHVLVPPDWAEAILRAHDEYPEAAAIGGPAENGSIASVAEWAAFFAGQGIYVPPLGVGTPATVLGLMNVSYKRWAIHDIQAVGDIGVNEVLHQRQLVRSGATLLFDDRIRSTHVQAMTLRSASSLSFHAGRAMAATRRSRMTAREWSRLMLTPISPPVLAARLGLTIVRRGTYLREFVAAYPAVVWLFACRATGELVGYAAGAGDSPGHLH